MPNQLKVRVIDPAKILFEGEAELVVAPGVKGSLGILVGHTPMFAELIKGTLSIKGASESSYEIDAGMLRVYKDEVTILVGL